MGSKEYATDSKYASFLSYNNKSIRIIQNTHDSYDSTPLGNFPSDVQ